MVERRLTSDLPDLQGTADVWYEILWVKLSALDEAEKNLWSRSSSIADGV